MKNVLILVACTVGLSACGNGPGGHSILLDNGADVSFLAQGTTSCPGVIESGNPIYERYPLRCGPQTQVVPY